MSLAELPVVRPYALPEWLEPRFGCSRLFSLGCEEELFVVDPRSGEPIDDAARVIADARPSGGRLAAELHRCQLELISPICSDAPEAVRSLLALRRSLAAAGGTVMGAGLHPSARFDSSPVASVPRYRRVERDLASLIRAPVGGLHVHVGMPDAETAIRACNGLRRHLPLLQALAANSPFAEGRDSGLASARMGVQRSWPRASIPRAFRDYEDFATTAIELARVAETDDYTWFWWEIRPHPLLGTVEVRTMDAQSSLDAVAGLIALVHGLARHEAEAAGAPLPAHEAIEECSFRATRFGSAARLLAADGSLRPVPELAREALALARPHARELGSDAPLEEIERIVREGNGADRQRRAWRDGGVGLVLRQLVEETLAGAAPPAAEI
jgi:carboxylate-amine ligase